MTTLRRSPPASFGLSHRTASAAVRACPPNGEDEAAKIADILGVTPFLEEDATAEAVIEALENAVHQHVSAHGLHIQHRCRRAPGHPAPRARQPG